MHTYLENRGWTRGEVDLWLAALVVAVALGVLGVANVLGAWVFLLIGLLATAVGIWRFRAEPKPRKATNGGDDG